MLAEYDAFLSYSSRDRAFVEMVAARLLAERLSLFWDQLFPLGIPWQRLVEDTLPACRSVVVFLGSGGLGDWQRSETELALERQRRDRNFQVIPVLLPDTDPPVHFLMQNTWVDFRQGLTDHWVRRLIAALRGDQRSVDLRESCVDPISSVCPYRGLLHFREEDHPFFYGRELAAELLLEKLSEKRLVMLVGASGSGKSSAVRAGLLPRVRGPSSETISCVPGTDPFGRLAIALLPWLESSLTETDRLVETRKLSDAMLEGRVKLSDVLGRIFEKHSNVSRLLIFIDQWEELYTQVAQGPARDLFVASILEAKRIASVSFVIALRGDFVGHAFAHRELSDALQNAQVNIGPMTREELAQAIVRPAEKLGRNLEPGLVERILDDLAAQPGALPLLQFLMEQLWHATTLRTMTHATYEALGKLGGALTKVAEDVFRSLGPAAQVEVRRIFLRLVRPGEGVDDVRRRARFTELDEGSRAIVKELVDRRLLVTAQDEAGQETLELSHEILISRWARLQSWVNEEREFLLWRERHRPFVEAWRQTGDESALLRGRILSQSERWLDDGSHSLATDERELLVQSVRYRQRLEEEDREKAQRELASAKHAAAERARSAQRLKRALAAVVAALVVATGLFVQAITQRRRAEQAHKRAEDLIDFLVFEVESSLSQSWESKLLRRVIDQVDSYRASQGDGTRERWRDIVATVYRAEAHYGANELNEAFATYKSALDSVARLQLQSADSKRKALVHLNQRLGVIATRQGRFSDAMSAYAAAASNLEALEKKAGTERDAADVAAQLADVLTRLDRASEARVFMIRSNAIYKSLTRREPENEGLRAAWVQSSTQLAQDLLEQRKLKEAFEQLQACSGDVDVLTKDLFSKKRRGKEADRIVELALTVGALQTMIARGLGLERELIIQRVQTNINLARSWLDVAPENPRVEHSLAVAHVILGGVYEDEGHLEEGLASYRRAAAVGDKSMDSTDVQAARVHWNALEAVARVLEKQSKPVEAQAAYRDALVFAERLPDDVLANEGDAIKQARERARSLRRQ